MKTTYHNNSTNPSKLKYIVEEYKQPLSCQIRDHNIPRIQQKLSTYYSDLIIHNHNTIIITKPIVGTFSNVKKTPVGRYYKIELTYTSCSEVFSYQHLFLRIL